MRKLPLSLASCEDLSAIKKPAARRVEAAAFSSACASWSLGSSSCVAVLASADLVSGCLLDLEGPLMASCPVERSAFDAANADGGKASAATKARVRIRVAEVALG